MTNYRVTWVIDLEADSPEEAAERAREYQQNYEGNTATVFQVVDRDYYEIFTVDLLDRPDDEEGA